MNANGLFEQIKKKRSYLCIGLDADYSRIPRLLMDTEYPLYEFNKQIIDQTHDLAVAYKPNLAFYESMGAAGWVNLELTVQYIREQYPDIYLIADAKRGDIGNTSKMYARAFFQQMDFDAITVAPYMGEDSLKPFLDFENKWIIILALTSNPGSGDFQMTVMKGTEKKLFQHVLSTTSKWGTSDNIMYVVGATRAAMLDEVRKLVPDHFLLVPGIGAQGGSLADVSSAGFNDRCGLLVNSSRAIIYADPTDQFARVARIKAKEVQTEMEQLLIEKKLISSTW